jgi:hypothetical protein
MSQIDGTICYCEQLSVEATHAAIDDRFEPD